MDRMSKSHENFIMTISTIVLGIVAGTGSLLLGAFLDLIESLFLNFNETATHPFAGLISPAHRMLSLVTGGLVAAVVWWLMRTRMKPAVGISKALDGQEMPVTTTIVHVLTQIFFVATGGSVGRELAPRELGAMLAQTWQRLLKRFRHIELSDDDRRLLIASAAGAGFAGVYIAPITGAMFCLELLYKKVTGRAVAVSLTMSSIAMLVGSLLRGFHPYYAVGSGAFSATSIFIVLILGPLCGILGAYFRQAFQWANQHQTRDNHLLWQLPAVAVVTGLIATTFPQIMGNGRALAQPAFMNQSVNLIWLFLIGGLAKAIVTVFSLRAGASGGTLTPSIAIGATIGMALGFAIHLFVPAISIWQAGIIGAASLLASSQQAPLMALFMLFEVCHLDHSALLPLGLGVALATTTSHVILNPSRSH
nr:chloride channel protein [Secundilactobacillus kimchicus]